MPGSPHCPAGRRPPPCEAPGGRKRNPGHETLAGECFSDPVSQARALRHATAHVAQRHATDQHIIVGAKKQEAVTGATVPLRLVALQSPAEGRASKGVIAPRGFPGHEEFAAAAAAITLAGEFNFTLLHLRGEMYAS